MGTTGTGRHDGKREIQITNIMSMRVSMRGTGAEQPVVVRKLL